MQNGVVHRKRGNELLFYVPENIDHNVIHKYHDEIGAFSPEKTYKAKLLIS